MRKKLKIAQIAPLWIPVPPITYGGIELILSMLTEELHKRGHKVTLFASGDSRTNAELVSVVKTALWLQKGIKNPHAPVINLTKIMHEKGLGFDLLHNHFNFFGFPASLNPDMPPILTTVHRLVDEYYASAMKTFDIIKYCAISEDHKKSMEEYGVAVSGVIPNGIDFNRYEFNGEPEDYFLYLGRLNSEKGIMTSFEVAKSAGIKLVIAGNVVGGDEWLYFLHEVQPHLNEPHVKFVGQVDFPEKIKLLKNAKALLFPIARREPFGLVMIEAMACGTPVIAFRKGSVPEIVEHGKTGFVVDTAEEMVQHIYRIPEISRLTCRRRVKENYTLERMTDLYEELYEKILAS